MQTSSSQYTISRNDLDIIVRRNTVPTYNKERLIHNNTV